MARPIVVLKTGVTDRHAGVRAALEELARSQDEELRARLTGKTILLKPNCVSATNQLAATHVAALRAVAEFVLSYNPKRVILGEGSAADTMSAFRNFGYLKLADELGLEMLDLNEDSTKEATIYDRQGRAFTVHVARTALESVRVSVVPPKTHDTVVATLSVKNTVMGGVIKRDKFRVHQGYPAINLNIALLAQVLLPDLGVIDGLIGMEGDGPIAGTPIAHGIALASLDPLALDATTADLMGFTPREIGYLVHAARLELGVIAPDEIELLADGDLAQVRRNYKPHRTYREQLNWQLAGTPFAAILERELAARGI